MPSLQKDCFVRGKFYSFITLKDGPSLLVYLSPADVGGIESSSGR